jgi:hypothetical protein
MQQQRERDLSVVILRMLDLIPASESELRDELEELYGSACYVEEKQKGAVTPPPDMQGMWTLCAGSLETHLSGKKPEPWMAVVSAIFNGRSR